MKLARFRNRALAYAVPGLLALAVIFGCHGDKQESQAEKLIELAKEQKHLEQNSKDLAKLASVRSALKDQVVEDEAFFNVVNANSVIKVSGGAMRFRSELPWTMSGTTYYRDGVDITAIVIDGANYTSGGKRPDPFSNLKGCWTMLLQGRKSSSPKTPSGYGITISAQNATCGGAHSVVLSPYTNDGSSNAGFYPDDSSTDDDGTYIKRFMDSTPDPQGCQGPSDKLNGDEDICERMLSIQLTLSAMDGGGTYNWTCTNGECKIIVGN